MPSKPTISYAAVASTAPAGIVQRAPLSTSKGEASDARITTAESTTTQEVKPRISFISGHLDITQDQFKQHYHYLIDSAAARGDTFVLSNARGADCMALAYLQSRTVPNERVSIYLHTPSNFRQNTRTNDALREKYGRDGYRVIIIQGGHPERDAAMTAASDVDILWLRGEDETREMYGARYRPDRVSGTEKNRRRRLEKRGNAVAT